MEGAPKAKFLKKLVGILGLIFIILGLNIENGEFWCARLVTRHRLPRD